KAAISLGTDTSIDAKNGALALKNSKASVTVDASGKLELKNTAQGLKALIDEFIDIVSSLQTIGSPSAQATNPATTGVQLTALKVKVGLLLK
ncbi:MAG: hypothetical protein ACRCUS_00595, partial [Anaerovoracaceae bacterium]